MTNNKMPLDVDTGGAIASPIHTINWEEIQELPSKHYKCGFCGQSLSSNKGYSATANGRFDAINIYVCHHCNFPTCFFYNGKQYPGSKPGNPVEFLPSEEVEELFNEAKLCYTVAAYTAVVMCCRKLLMNIAVNKNAEPGKSFISYVEYLDEKGFIPPAGKDWVNKIKDLGNEANHQIRSKIKADADLILGFTELLLKIVYEAEGKLKEFAN